MAAESCLSRLDYDIASRRPKPPTPHVQDLTARQRGHSPGAKRPESRVFGTSTALGQATMPKNSHAVMVASFRMRGDSKPSV